MLIKGITFLSGLSAVLLLADDQALIPGIFIALAGLAWLLFMPFLAKFLPANHPVGNKFSRLVTSLLTISHSLKYFLLGVIWGCLHALLWLNYSGNLITQPQVSQLQGQICSIPYKKYASYKFDFCVDTIDDKPVPVGKLKRLKFTWSQYVKQPDSALAAGQHWQFKAKLTPPHTRYNEAGFDYQKWMLAQGYAGQGKVKQDAKLIDKQLSNSKTLFHAARQKLYHKLNDLIADSKYKGMLLALAMGERSQIDQQGWDILRHSGSSHLLAISGLHIGVAALWAYWLVFYLWRLNVRLCQFYPAQKAANIAALFGALSMLLISGMGIPAQRAFIMLAVFFVSRIFARHYQLSSVLGIALVIILLIHPFAPLSISFWLSFIAVFVISLYLQKQTRQATKIILWFKLNWQLFLLMLPLTAAFFGLSSFISFIANLVLVPLVSFLLIPLLYLAMLILPLFEPFAQQLFTLASLTMSAVYWLQCFFADMNKTVSQFDLHQLFYLVVVFVSILLLSPKKIFSRMIYLPLSIALVYSFFIKENQTEFEMVVFDIGQGLAIYAQTPQGTFLYDTGWGTKEYALAESVILPFLKSRRITQLDKLIISHADADHAGGVKQIYQQIKIKQLIAGEKIPGYQSVDCHNYPAWHWGEVQLKFLNHLPASRRRGNNASCVLQLITPAGKILLTGDIQKSAEKALIKQGIAKHQIVIAPHHGSNTSSTPEFVKRTMADAVIFSAGYNNQWGFPKNQVVTRFNNIGSQIWTTFQHGAIYISYQPLADGVSERQFNISSQRQLKSHFWLR